MFSFVTLALLSAAQPAPTTQTLNLADGEKWQGTVLSSDAQFIQFKRDDGRTFSIAKDSVASEEVSTSTESDGGEHKDLVSTEALQTLVSLFSLEYEHATGQHVALYAGAEGSPLFGAIGAGVGGRYYKDRALTGPFVDLHADVFAANGKILEGSYRKVGAGFLVGTNHSFSEHWLVSLGVGAELADVASTDTRLSANLSCGTVLCYPGFGTTTTSEEGARMLLNARAAIGYTF